MSFITLKKVVIYLSDGKVIIDTELDGKGAEKGISTLYKTLSGIGKVGSVAL